MDHEPILIAGVDAIARELGLSTTTVEREIIGRPGFPARQLSPHGQWLTTRQKLTEWAETMLPKPYFGESLKRPPREPESLPPARENDRRTNSSKRRRSSTAN